MVLDALVGVGFVAAALAARSGPLSLRALWALVGIAWWLGALEPLRVLHQGVLLVALACFPTGRPDTPARRATVVLGALVAPGLVGQSGAALAFGGAALLGARRGSLVPVAAGAVGVWLAVSAAWFRVAPTSFDPAEALLGYQLVLLGVALALPAGLAAEERRPARISDRVLAAAPGGLPGLEEALRLTLDDASLRLERHGEDVVVTAGREHDPATLAAVRRAVRLTTEHERVLADAEQRLRELEAARARLLAAADREREHAARRLRGDLVALRSLQDSLTHLPEVSRELEAAVADVGRILSGLAPEGLGGGGIGPAIRRLCERHPVPVDSDLDEGAGGDLVAETALYYACSEALANSAKHAQATRVSVRLAHGDPLVLTVADDGVGGADPSGSGLVNLADRVAAAGGRLVLASAEDTGTRLEVRVPARTPSSQSMRT